MALFHVARYAGPEAAGAEAEAAGRARALLERLQCRARERQQQKQPPQQEAARTSEAAGRRRRRPRRARRREGGGAAGSPHAPRGKRRKVDDEDAGGAGQGRGRGRGARVRGGLTRRPGPFLPRREQRGGAGRERRGRRGRGAAGRPRRTAPRRGVGASSPRPPARGLWKKQGAKGERPGEGRETFDDFASAGNWVWVVAVLPVLVG